MLIASLIRWEISSRPLVWPDGSSKSLRARAREFTLVTARDRTLVTARDGVREIACVLAANGAQAFRRDAPLADEEGNKHALRGLSDAPLAGGAGGAGRALVDDQGEGWKRKDRRSRRRPTVVLLGFASSRSVRLALAHGL